MTGQPGEAVDAQAEYRKLPAVDAVLRSEQAAALAGIYGTAQVTATLRDLLDAARRAIGQGNPAPDPEGWPDRLAAALEGVFQPTLRPVINATGVIVHTNLGRAPLSDAALDAVRSVSLGYSNLEYDLAQGQRGSRHDHARTLVQTLTGAEDALVVNNNAGAVYLVLAAHCQGREVVISRGQLVEIGGGFRIPDVLRQSGARLVEVGTTNRTYGSDYDAALNADSAAIMRIHSSNFRQTGFVAQPDLAELAQIVRRYRQAHGAPLILIDDLGSGTLLDTGRFGLAREPLVQESLAAGADLVTFSGDKLLGGPQAGFIVGRREFVEPIRRHPMARALRVDKMTLAAVEATLHSYRRGRAEIEIPVWRMIAARSDELRARAEAWRARLGARPAEGIELSIQPGESAVGGGSLPGETLPTMLLALCGDGVEERAAALRRHDPPVICRIQNDRLLFDPRTVLPEQDADLVDALKAVLAM